MSFNRLKYALCLCLIFAGGTGCGYSGNDLPRASVRGIVMLDEEPLAQGVIRFIPQRDNKGPKSFATIRNGMFKIDEENGPVVGESRIEIESTDDGGYAPDDEQALKKLKASRTKRIKIVKVPVQYNSRSTLTKNIVKDADNDFRFDLSSKRKKR